MVAAIAQAEEEKRVGAGWRKRDFILDGIGSGIRQIICFSFYFQ
jgi:hypothetical protein